MVAGMLLATCFVASATALKKLSKGMTNGGEYILSFFESGKVLVVEDDKLTMVRIDEFDGYSYAKRDSNTWITRWTTDATGKKAYTFTNKMTGKLLTLPPYTQSDVYVNWEGGISKFTWKDDPTSPDSASMSGNISASVQIKLCKAIMVKNGFTGSKQTYAQLAADTANCREIVCTFKLDSESVPSIPNIDDAFRPFSTGSGEDGDSISIEPAKKAKEAVRAIRKILEGGDSDSNFNCFWILANLIDGLEIPEDSTKKVYAGSIFKYDDGGRQRSSLVSEAISQVTSHIKCSPYGYAVGTTSGWKGVIAGTASNLCSDEYYKPEETIFVPMDEQGICPLQYGYEELADDGRYFGSGTIDKPEDDPTYIKKFANAFREGEQPDSSIAITLDFTGSDVPTATNNLLAGRKIRLIRKNLLFDGTISNLDQPDNLSDFRWAQMIYDPEEDKYLYVSSDTYDESAQSTNFVLKWVSLKDLSGCLTGTDNNAPKAGVSYNNVCDEEGNVLPHAGSAIFRILYNRSDSSVVVFPTRLYLKKNEASAADTTGSFTYYNYKENAYDASMSNLPDFVLGLKKFGSDVVLTVVNTSTDKVYPIHKAITNKDSDDVLRNYTKAETESDIYLIRYVSNEASRAEENGKYYTAYGMKDLTEFEANNHAENQWALFTDAKDSTVTILNRETADTLVVGGVPINGVKLYKGSALKADIDSYVTIPRGDTLMLTPLNAIYKSSAALGEFACDSVFNSVSRYRFSYYNGLDNSKKLNIDNNGVLFVDPEGGSAEFALTAKDTTYGAPSIPGKSTVLTKSIYTLSTEIKDSTYYVTMNDGKYVVTKDSADAARFCFKAMEVKGDNLNDWYALVEYDRSGKASVDDNTLRLLKEPITEVRTSMFAISVETYDIYRRLGKTINDGLTYQDTAYVEFYKVNEPNRYLYENSGNIVAGIEPDGLGYLGIYNKNDMTRNASIFVDPACVADSVIMPTYLMVVDVMAEADTLSGRYLVSLSDSTARKAAKYNGYTRLAFVDAKHMGDSLVISKDSLATAKDTIALTKDLSKATFAFELTDKVEKNPDADFYIQNADGYVWINNGVPVLTDDKEKAVVFNARKTDVVATANEEISAETVKVIAGEGFVVVKGAEGKKVTISNVLGQKIATAIASGDELRIAAPAGILLVIIEGEPAVKAIVK